jgi:hypothetical protein
VPPTMRPRSPTSGASSLSFAPKYFAVDWAEGKSIEEIEAEVARVEDKARNHHYQWNEVGNVTCDYIRIDTLNGILQARRSA